MLANVTLAMPAPLAPGDAAHVVAPSSPYERADLLPGLAWVATRYRLRLSPGIFLRDAYLAGSDARRGAELRAAMRDDGSKAVLAARGGYGAMRVLADLPWSAFADRPQWIVGHSDVTALHAMAWRAGIASVHGPNVTGLGPAASPAVRAAWLGALERPNAPRTWRRLRVLHPGAASGVLVGGNLALLHAMAAAGLLWIPLGAVVAMEDVTEPPYRVDRMLTSLLLGKHLDRAGAVVFGGFERCPPGKDGRTVEEVIEERTRALGVPVLSGAPFGHGNHNEAFVLGAHARVVGDEVRLGAAEEPPAGAG